MKAKYYIGILSAMLLAGYPLKAQITDNRNFRNDDAGLVINNYYDDYDYYYSSRINRFHRSYTAFDYYSPMFTDTYWYNYQPYTWGLSIYGRNGLGFGFSFNYPVYYYGWGYNNLYNYYDNSPRYSSRQYPSDRRPEYNRDNGGYSRRESMPSRPQVETRSSMPSERRSSVSTNSRSERSYNAPSRSSSPARSTPQVRSSSSGRSGSSVSKSSASSSKSSKGSSSRSKSRR